MKCRCWNPARPHEADCPFYRAQERAREAERARAERLLATVRRTRE